MKRRGINAENLTKLDLLNRKFQSPFSVEEAGEVLEMPPLPVRRLLARFAAQGWLTRLRRDAYRTVPMGATNPAEIREDPWLVADHAFTPCYFGGWTACEHWGLTEQLFRDVIVVTGRRVRYREVMIQDTKYLLHVRQEKAFFGLKKVWRSQSQVLVSDPSRTIVDLLDCPSMGGGIRAVGDCLEHYWNGSHKNAHQLLEYALKLGNRTVLKRLGYLLETLKLDEGEAVVTCLGNLSKGISNLDPDGEDRGRILKRWNLRLNATIAPMEEPS
jgi:predicted transcriptional regulator of viral defense system